MLIVVQPKSGLNLQPRSLSVRICSTLISITGIIFIGISGVAGFACQRQSIAEISGDKNICVLDVSSGFTATDREIALTDLRRAALKQELPNGHSAYQRPAYQVVLLTRKGEIPLTDSSPTDKEEKLQTVEKINQFLWNPGKSDLQVNFGNYDWRDGLGLFLATVGIGAQLFAEQITRCCSEVRET